MDVFPANIDSLIRGYFNVWWQAIDDREHSKFIPVAGVEPTTTFSSMLLNDANLIAYPEPAPSNSLYPKGLKGIK